MHPMRTVFLFVTLGAAIAVAAQGQFPPLPDKAPGPHVGLDAPVHAGSASFTFGAPVVGTSYFYWYDIESGAHIIDGDGSDALTTHPSDMTDLSYRHASWHRTQMEDMIDAGIDFLMPVFWGVPGQYEGWSFAGLGPLVEAHRALETEGKRPPFIGMFFDTSILSHNAYGSSGEPYHADLATDFGRRWFYTAIRDFFSLIPPEMWARVDGKPIIFLYAGSFAKAQTPEEFQDVRAWFRQDFGCNPFIVKMRDWQGEADAQYQWGGAIELMLDEHVAGLGPGYDHSAVAGRDPRVVDREFGWRYANHWLRLLRMSVESRPWMVHVETWNEWHEGTDVAASREYGRLYIMLTKVFSDMWRAKQLLKPVGPFVEAGSVAWEQGVANGISIRLSDGDGVWRENEAGGRKAVVSQENPETPNSRYLYFDVDDGFSLTLNGGAALVEVTYWDTGCEAFALEYDSTDPESGPVSGSFRDGGSKTLGQTGVWQTAVFEIDKCRFGNRSNGGDFRLAVRGGAQELAVCKVTVLRK
ncbi:MAG TPA: DUF5010 domain-containing protein [Candidatus Hydrogenedentes bacterium]|nr:DUF5010 domain-containing protein [Candidatus Hydrogenedentota bacterium]